ncbi:hypothetical protein Voc01_034510 [Virgisporangium ochraceum]|uniref:Uncharacterized protein n=1 Tax=Virgisporangium ochraceum TaxID=65505 RepID=A0A8J3ZRE4_9ACTN|nr:hypothetical protein Voc01_034510 [Virgisporangium ochraceum]
MVVEIRRAVPGVRRVDRDTGLAEIGRVRDRETVERGLRGVAGHHRDPAAGGGDVQRHGRGQRTQPGGGLRSPREVAAPSSTRTPGPHQPAGHLEPDSLVRAVPYTAVPGTPSYEGLRRLQAVRV